MNFKLEISKYVLGILTEKDLPDIGICGISEGYDSDNMRILASLNKNESPFLANDYLILALKDFEIELPDKKQSAKNIIFDLVKGIIDNGVDPYDGTKKIEKIISNSTFDWEDFDLFDVYCDYIVVWEDWSNGINTEKEKKILLDSISNWYNKNKNLQHMYKQH